MHGFMIAADRSGAGKTTVTRALMLALMKRGFSVCPFKCGPDYIDPMYHSAITGVPGHNLDTFFTDEDTTRKIFARDLEDAPETNRIAVAEGVMGLFDGVTGFLPEGSSYDMARVLQMPVILCINARGAAQTLLAVISGILNNDIQKLIKGIFLNQVSDGFAPVLSQKIEEAFEIPVVGHFPVTDEIKVGSRHLGLLKPDDFDEKNQDEALLRLVDKRINIDMIYKISEMPDADFMGSEAPSHKLKLASANDEAFDFFYRENEIMLQDLGAEIVHFSPIHDSALPDDIDGLILPGGYPEFYAGELADNRSMTESVRDAYTNALPMLAECGGFMYLHRSIGGRGPLVNLFGEDCHNTGRNVRFGYLSCYDKAHYFVKEGHRIKGHEFHYYDMDDVGHDAIAEKPYSDRRRELGYVDIWSFLSFAHFYYPSCPEFARHFMEGVREHARRRSLQK